MARIITSAMRRRLFESKAPVRRVVRTSRPSIKSESRIANLRRKQMFLERVKIAMRKRMLESKRLERNHRIDEMRRRFRKSEGFSAASSRLDALRARAERLKARAERCSERCSERINRRPSRLSSLREMAQARRSRIFRRHETRSPRLSILRRRGF